MHQSHFCVLAPVGLAAPALAEAPPAAPVTPYADVRYRLELVDQAGLPEDAAASTLRVRAGIKTREWQHFSAVIEGETILAIGAAHYNDTVNGKAAYPVVADPTDTLLNQAYLRWRPSAAVDATVGRQAVNVENQRWIGSVGWRQDDQTLDAARVTVRPRPDLSLDYFHVWRVNRVFGPDSPQGIWRDTAINGARAAYTIKGFGTLSGYGYWLVLPAFPAGSSRTLGVRMAGERPVGKGVLILYAAEFARQHTLSNNPRTFALDYLLLEPGLKAGPVTLRLGYERLEGDGAAALQTPLATLHAFNGWADKFLTTPGNGLEDLYVDAGYKVGGKALGGLTLRGMWHRFRSTRAGLDYGSEWNALASYPLNPKITVLAKFARYNARSFATDTTKAWFSVEAKF